MADACLKCGICCRLFVINLSEKEYKSGFYKAQFEEFGIVEDFTEAELCGANIIEQKEDGSCFYLQEGRCSIHERRPEACRNFFCTSKDEKFITMIEKVRAAKNG